MGRRKHPLPRAARRDLKPVPARRAPGGLFSLRHVEEENPLSTVSPSIALFKELYEAINCGDLDRAVAVYAPDVHYVLLAARDSTGDPAHRSEAASGPTSLDDAEISDQAMTFFIAGAETAFNLLSWALHLLAQHPRARAEVEAEADTVLAGGPVLHAHLPRLETTRRVITETLRLYPPACNGIRLPDRGRHDRLPPRPSARRTPTRVDGEGCDSDHPLVSGSRVLRTSLSSPALARY